MTNLTKHSLRDFKVGLGPMSKEIVSSIVNNLSYPMMIIASRNQVDYNSGYVYQTKQLAENIEKSQNLLLCRDHCGPYFSDSDKNLTIEEAIIECKKTIKADIDAGFDIIHVDVSRIKTNQLEYGQELIEYAINLNPSIILEFGSEDNTGVNIDSSIGRIEPQLEFLQRYKNNVAFFVTQTGSLTKSHQVGNFDVDRNKEVAKLIHDAGFLFKEHNADYFTQGDLRDRKLAGIDSLNIAPQLGVIQTTLLHQHAPDDLWDKFSSLVYSKNYWERWVSDKRDQHTATIVSGHYCYNSKEYTDIINNIDYSEFKAQLSNKIYDLMTHYNYFGNQHDFETTEKTVSDNKKPTKPTMTEEEKRKKNEEMAKKKLEELRKRDPFIYR